jgi:hypothetical protein
MIDGPEYATATGLIAHAAKYQSDDANRFDQSSISGAFNSIKEFFKNNF